MNHMKVSQVATSGLFGLWQDRPGPAHVHNLRIDRGRTNSSREHSAMMGGTLSTGYP